MALRESLEAAYQKMAGLTKPKCGGSGCAPYKPGRCCERMYCEMAKSIAMDEYGVDLEYVDSAADVPFLKDGACVVPPHMRPLCTLHTCKISAIGCDPTDPTWTKEYFALRDQIEHLERLRISGKRK